MSKKFFKSFLLKIQMSKKLLKHLLFFDSYSPSYSYVFTTPARVFTKFWNLFRIDFFGSYINFNSIFGNSFSGFPSAYLTQLFQYLHGIRHWKLESTTEN